MSNNNSQSINNSISAVNAAPAFMLAIIGGLLIIVGSLVGLGWAFYTGSTFGMMSAGYPYMMGPLGNIYGEIVAVYAVVGVVAGIMVLVSAFQLRSRPAGNRVFALLLVAFSIVSLVALGGFLIGAALGVIGGIVALTKRRGLH